MRSRAVLFVYLWTEAIQTYYNLWSSRTDAPFAAVVQRHGMGGQWTMLDGDCLFYAVATKLPEYLYVGDLGSVPWPNYVPVTRPRVDEYSMHRSKRVLFKCTHPMRLNQSSPLLQWDLNSDTIDSEKYPDFKEIKLFPKKNNRLHQMP